jgi:CspA family cold shock protein
MPTDTNDAVDLLLYRSCVFVETPTLMPTYPEYLNYQWEPDENEPIYSVVVWFNPKRRFGFVELSDGSGDAFLHRNVLVRAGIEAEEPCTTLKVRVIRGDRGPLVVDVLHIDRRTAVPTARWHRKGKSSAPSVKELGKVKSFNPKRGYGSIARDGGGKDVFVHVSVLEAAGLRSLSEGQRVVVVVTEGRGGAKAKWIRFPRKLRARASEPSGSHLDRG